MRVESWKTPFRTGLVVYEGTKRLDGASDEFLDFVKNHSRLPKTLRLMVQHKAMAKEYPEHWA